MKYIVDVGGVRLEVDLDGGKARVDGGEPVDARIASLPGTPMRLVTIGGAVHRVLARREGERGCYTLGIDARRFSILALDERARAIRDMLAATAVAAGPRPLTAPMPGLIIRVSVAVGDDVQAGQGVIAMEAMKMENELRVLVAGRVCAVHVAPGTAVEKGATLIEFE